MGSYDIYFSKSFGDNFFLIRFLIKNVSVLRFNLTEDKKASIQ